MSRRASLPGAAELFRATGGFDDEVAEPARSWPPGIAEDTTEAQTSGAAAAEAPTALGVAPSGVRQTTRRRQLAGERRPSGRERHEEKITVYCSPDELIDLEQARLTLRGEHGLAVDRGRIVREAVAVVIADLEAKGESSILVRRLRGS